MFVSAIFARMKAFCTIISEDFIGYASALHRSISRFVSIPFEVLVIDSAGTSETGYALADGIQITRLGPDIFDETGVVILNKYDCDQDLLRWSLKSVWLYHLMEQKGFEQVIFLDPNLFFF
jgi:hypothetical protein